MKSVYTGGEKVAEFESYDEFRVGDGKPAFIYEGNDLVYPNPVKDGLVLWYDFSGRTNADGQRGIAEDLSGNGNHGTLQNFNFTPESGYDKNKLLFDGVDDYIAFDNPIPEQTDTTQSWSVEMVVAVNDLKYNSLLQGWNAGIIARVVNETQIRFLNYTNLTGYIYSTYYANPGDMLHLVATHDHGILTTSITVNGGNTDSRENEIGYTPSGISPVLRINNAVFADSYSLRIYNRPLTPEEIAHNYALEKERFGIE